MEYKIKLQASADADVMMELAVPEGTTYEEICRAHIDDVDDPIMLAVMNGSLRELATAVDEDGSLYFLSMTNRDGKRTYRRSVSFLLQRAVQLLWGDEEQLRVLYSLGEGYYCKLSSVEMTVENLELLDAKMRELVAQDIPIVKTVAKTRDAERLFEDLGWTDKARILHYRQGSHVNLYSIGDLTNYFYGYMAPSTGYLKYFELVFYEEGFVVMFPNRIAHKVEKLETSTKLYRSLKTSREWSRMLNIGTIGALNEAIADGRGQEIILLQEAMMEEQIGSIAMRVAWDRSKKFVMIAGPSSSGKTSFANRLCVQMLANGLTPHLLSLDDYYADRSKCPRNEKGEYDFECLEALDVAQFQHDMKELLAGQEVEMPSFNFKTGMREYHGRRLRLQENDVLVIEGIHGLNDRMTEGLPAESKFRIYISALTQLNIDEHNPLSTTDGRLIRRIVRDARSRGSDAQETIGMWDSVRRGEEANIFPYQDSADVYFNSALVYELSVLKVYAEPLLYRVPRDCPESIEAKRLLKLLSYYLPLSTEAIASNSLMREFIGGSCFAV